MFPPLNFFPELLASSKIAWVWIPLTSVDLQWNAKKASTEGEKEAGLNILDQVFFPSQIIKSYKIWFLKC